MRRKPFTRAEASLEWIQTDVIVLFYQYLAFYSGWPNAMSCMAVAKEIFQKQPEQQ